MSDREIVAALAKLNPYRFGLDAGSNVVCALCGSFRDFEQRDGSGRGPWSHKPDCVWKAAETAAAQPEALT